MSCNQTGNSKKLYLVRYPNLVVLLRFVKKRPTLLLAGWVLSNVRD